VEQGANGVTLRYSATILHRCRTLDITVDDEVVQVVKVGLAPVNTQRNGQNRQDADSCLIDKERVPHFPLKLDVTKPRPS
jgi:hypothetical protein